MGEKNGICKKLCFRQVGRPETRVEPNTNQTTQTESDLKLSRVKDGSTRNYLGQYKHYLLTQTRPKLSTWY